SRAYGSCSTSHASFGWIARVLPPFAGGKRGRTESLRPVDVLPIRADGCRAGFERVRNGNHEGMFAFCSTCGARMGLATVRGRHECRYDQLLAYQTRRAQTELANCLESRVSAWEREPQIAPRRYGRT